MFNESGDLVKATAVAPSNIAFIKYWGRSNDGLRLPANPSISMNLSACTTTTTVEFVKDANEDFIPQDFDTKRICKHLDRIRDLAKTKLYAVVTTKNSFPTGTGVASSASGFAALTLAACRALGLNLSQKKLTALARLGSGSAARSIPDGFVKWEKEHAYSLYPSSYWDLRDIIVLVDKTTKTVSSSEGHKHAKTSPFFTKRLEALPKRILRLEKALKTKDFKEFSAVVIEECLDMHHVMQTQTPPLNYWNDDTKKVIQEISGLPGCYTIDAGPNVHVLCEAKNEQMFSKRLSRWPVIVNKPAKGAHII